MNKLPVFKIGLTTSLSLDVWFMFLEVFHAFSSTSGSLLRAISKSLEYDNELYFFFCSVWSAAIDALTAFIRCFVCPNAGSKGILLQPVLLYLNRYCHFIGMPSFEYHFCC